VAVPNQSGAPIRQPQVLHRHQEGVRLQLDGLGKQAARAGAQHVRQGIVKVFRLTKPDDVGRCLQRRIALDERFWQARHPPRYAAFNTPSSPILPHSSRDAPSLRQPSCHSPRTCIGRGPETGSTPDRRCTNFEPGPPNAGRPPQPGARRSRQGDVLTGLITTANHPDGADDVVKAFIGHPIAGDDSLITLNRITPSVGASRAFSPG